MAIKLKVEFIDGYSHTFELKEGSEIRYEQNYIYLVTASDGERYIPMCNIRWFGQRIE